MGSRDWTDIERADLTLGFQCMGWFRGSEIQVYLCWLRFE